MPNLKDIAIAKRMPALHMLRSLDAIEKKVLEITTKQLETEIQNAINDIKESERTFVEGVATEVSNDTSSTITEKRMEELKTMVMDSMRVEIANNVKKVLLENVELFKGEDGKTPKKGKDYRDGSDGKTPKKGIDYFDGKDGKTPKKGIDYFDGISPRMEDVADKLIADNKFIAKTKGKDGAPDTGEQIANKLNKTQESVNLNVIKGLTEALKNIRMLARKKSGGGGGGMGSPISFQFSGDGATTSFDLGATPSGNGNIKAIWVNYQGQQQHPVTHFTVSGSTLSMTFTPASGTFIEGILIP